MTQVALGLGSNMGDRLAHLRAAVAGIVRFAAVTARSSVYETEPREVEDQPPFLNVVVLVLTDLAPHQLLGECQRIEAEEGRVRARPMGPRTLDIDILLWGDAIIADPDLVVPHPRLASRRFVLEPLAEVAADARVPPGGRTVRELLASCSDRGRVVRTALGLV